MPKLRGIATILYIIGLLLITASTAHTQSLSLLYIPSYGDTTIIAFLGDIERNTDVSLSYSTSQFDAYSRVELASKTFTIEEALRTLFSAYKVILTERPNKKIIVSVNDYIINTKYFTTNGYILDSDSGEKLYGAAIYHMGKDRGTYSNTEGFYSISNIQKGDVLRVSYIGYRDEFISVDTSSLQVQLSADLEVSTIIITQAPNSINPSTGGDVIDLNSASAKVNILGEKDLIHMARQKAGVYSGSEGLGGLIVRGGSPDQNLMLLEGIPMYATNHMADISSIFMEEATRDAQLIKGGFPSRYSGRLSSVLEVNLKDGNQERVKGSVSAGLPGFKAFLQGPISDKSTFLIGGRLSWVNFYTNPLIDKFTVFDDVDLNFHDFVAKYTYRFSNTSSFSISGYKGGDKVELEKNQTLPNDNGGSFNSQEQTSFGWGNELLSARFSMVISPKLFLNVNAGVLNYDYRSKAAYNFVNVEGGQVIKEDNRNVITDSGIVNLIGGIGFDYFLNSSHKIKLGVGYNHHRFSPKIEQNFVDDIDDPSIDPDSITVCNEVSLFIEDTYTPNKRMQIYGGLNYTHFGVRGVGFNYFQPRIKVNIQPQRDISLSFTGSRMVQFVHLLVNNGLGLPSDLWVPSTDEIMPEISDQFGLTLRTELGYDHVFTLGGYIKRQQNVILYRNPQDLYSNILNDASSELNFISDRDWERKIEIGNRNISGLEVSLQKANGPWQYNMSYTKSNAENRFENLNQGKAFADRYDRPHDVNLSLSYKINSKWDLGAQWVYGSGFTFTLKLIEIKIPDGPTVLTTDELNNYRMPAYHHLDLIANYDNTSDGLGWKVSFGVYNIYNRYNPYFIYGFEDSIGNRRIFKKLSLFPIYPHFNTTYSF
ncbi:MAG: carboxypeptidase-like regulatory domain-containing protein [Saprospiraceae bacterium]|nr:carboxypeptidase-like regulatory domain-containing protein [Saprospiraceae bacterium]